MAHTSYQDSLGDKMKRRYIGIIPILLFLLIGIIVVGADIQPQVIKASKMSTDAIFTELKYNDDFKTEAVFTLNSPALVSLPKERLTFDFIEICGKVKSYDVLVWQSCPFENNTNVYYTESVCNDVLSNITKTIEKVCRDNQVLNYTETKIYYKMDYCASDYIVSGKSDYKIDADIEWENCGNGWGYEIDWVPSLIDEKIEYTKDEWAWWNATWDYKKNITLTNISHTIEPVVITLSSICGANCNANFSDIRVYDETNAIDIDYEFLNISLFHTKGTAMIPYYIQFIVPNASHNNVIYYGNANAINVDTKVFNFTYAFPIGQNQGFTGANTNPSDNRYINDGVGNISMYTTNTGAVFVNLTERGQNGDRFSSVYFYDEDTNDFGRSVYWSLSPTIGWGISYDDNTGQPTHYALHTVVWYMGPVRSANWHVMEIEANFSVDSQVTFDKSFVITTSQSNSLNFIDRISIAMQFSGGANYNVDNYRSSPNRFEQYLIPNIPTLGAEETNVVINTAPETPANLTWVTEGGVVNDVSLLYNEQITEVNVSAFDTDSFDLNVSVLLFNPSGTLVFTTNLTNTTATSWNGSLNYILNVAGDWNLTFSAYDGEIYSNNSVIVAVTTTVLNTTSGWYGFTFESIPVSADFADIRAYNYEIVEIEEDINNFNANWTDILVSINKSYDENIRIGLNLVLSFNYTNTTRLAELESDITSTLGDLKTDPYSITTEYITFEVEDIALYNDSSLTNVLNNLAEETIDATDNKFPVYSKNYNSSALDSSYILTTVFLYLDYANETDLINAETVLLRNTTNLNRIYVNLPTVLRDVAKTYQDEILTQIRGVPAGNNSLSDTRTAEINTVTDDIVVFNNQSSEQEFTITVLEFIACNNTDLWDSTNKLLLESDTDLVFNVNVSRYSAVLLFCEDLSHIQLTSNNEGTVYKTAVGTVDNFNYTDGTYSDAFAIAEEYDAKIELNDPHFTRNKFITYYGWLNVSRVTNWEDYDTAIISDQNNAEIDSLPFNETDFYGYISVADYVNSEEWNNNKSQEVDDWLALNESMYIFVDGLDTGVGGENFSTRMKILVDYIKISKGRKVGLNTYTAYEDFCTWSRPDGFCMKESCVSRWNGTSATTVTSYERENWDLELDKSAWYTSHDVEIVCQVFSNRTINPITIENYTDVQNNYFAAKVLGYDKVYVSQPDFQYAYEQWFYDTGTMLATDYSTDDNETYYRRYSNGIVYYNSSSGIGWIDDGRVINNVEVCMKLQDTSDSPPASGTDNTGFSFGVATSPNDEQNDEYSWTGAELTSNKAWFCKDLLTADVFSNGRYFINMRITDRAEAADNGIYLLNDVVSETGRHSWWDASSGDPTWTIYDENKNWMVSIKINETKKTSIDTSTKITQTLANYTGATDLLYNTNVTLESNNPFNIEIWSTAITHTGNYQGSVSYWNTTDWVSMNLSSTTTCDSDNPSFSSTTIDGEIHKACYEPSGSDYIYRFAAPSLSTRVYRIGDANSCSPTALNTNWNLVIDDNCILSTNTNLGTGNLTVSGTGESGYEFLMDANLTINKYIPQCIAGCKIATSGHNWWARR